MSGIQLMFGGVGKIESPCFCAKKFDESKLTKSPFTKNENATKIKVRVNDGKYHNEIKFFSGDNEILTSDQFTSNGSFVEQNIGVDERIIGVYGVKN